MFSKFKNFLNLFKSKGFFGICFLFGCATSGVLFKKKKFRIILVMAILLPCFINIYPLLGGQVIFKSFKSFQMAVGVPVVQKLTKISRTSSISDYSVVFQEGEFRQKSVSKDGGSFIEFLPSVSAYGEEIAKQDTDKESSYPDSRMRKYIDKQIVQCFFAFILVLTGYAVIGYAIIFIIRKLYYYLT